MQSSHNSFCFTVKLAPQIVTDLSVNASGQVDTVTSKDLATGPSTLDSLC